MLRTFAGPAKDADRFTPVRVAHFKLDLGNSVIKNSGFAPSGKRSAETVAQRVAALTQPTGAALPQQLPDGLTEGDSAQSKPTYQSVISAF